MLNEPFRVKEKGEEGYGLDDFILGWLDRNFYILFIIVLVLCFVVPISAFFYNTYFKQCACY